MADDPIEKCETTWARLCEITGWSISVATNKRRAMIEDNVIFYELRGAPHHWVVCFYPSRLKDWQSKQGRKLPKEIRCGAAA
jgi:hypothetical protein